MDFETKTTSTACLEAVETQEDILTTNVDAMVKRINECLPVDDGGITVSNIDDGAVITTKLQCQMLTDDVISELSERLPLTTLLKARDDSGRMTELIAFSSPVLGEMCAIQLKSSQYGVVEEVSVIVFESADIMYKRLAECLEQRRAGNSLVLHTIDDAQLLVVFM